MFCVAFRGCRAKSTYYPNGWRRDVKRVANTDKQGVFLATNVAYYPSIGGTERILQMVAESVAADFERVIVFSQGGGEKPYFINGVEVRRYSKWGLRLFSMCIRPRIYFPN